ncbi:hypothetical protein IJ707_07140, partial [bacterium]|nr:hypothetical protein [bacterium]
MIEGNDGYYCYSKFLYKHLYYEELEKCTNYILKIKNKIISINPNCENKTQCFYEIVAIIDNQTISMCVKPLELENSDILVKKLSEKAFIISSIEKFIFRAYIQKTLQNARDLPTITKTELAGYNKILGNEYFVTANKCLSYAQNSNPDIDIQLSKEAYLQPIFKTTEDILSDKKSSLYPRSTQNSTDKELTKNILLALFNMIEKAYNNRIEPFLVLGISFIFVYLNAISRDFEGIPIVVLYGEAASGKTNLLRLIAYSYGLKPNTLHSGMDTLASILKDFNYLSNISVLIDEVENNIVSIISLIKNVYGQNQRKTYYSKANIKSSIFMNSNHRFLFDLEYKNRCIEFDFEQENFKPDEAKKFNEYQQYLSIVTAYLIENIPYENIKTMIENEECSELLKEISDSRTKRNLAIAVSGLKLLINLVNSEDKFGIIQFKDRLVDYINGTQCIYEEEVDKFISVLTELLSIKNPKLILGKDYKILDNGIHLLISKKNKSFEQQFKHKYKNMYEQKPLELKAYSKLLKKYGAEMNNTHYSKEKSTLYGLFLPFDKFDELAYLKPF